MLRPEYKKYNRGNGNLKELWSTDRKKINPLKLTYRQHYVSFSKHFLRASFFALVVLKQVRFFYFTNKLNTDAHNAMQVPK